MNEGATFGLEADFEKTFDSGPTIRARLSVPGPSGRVTILFGPSGVGKTTVLRCLAGLERPTMGRILFDGEVWVDSVRRINLPPQRRPVGYLSQDYSLFPHLTVRRNVGYNLPADSATAKDSRISELLQSFGIAALSERYPHEISGGQQQRVALARALARNPRLLLLDEPLSSLDFPTRSQIRTELGQILHRLGIPVIVITHDWVEALALGDDLAVIGKEGILQSGPPHDVFTRPAHLEVAEAVGVETIVSCSVKERANGMLLLQAGSHLIRVPDPGLPGFEFYLCLRGEDVMLERGEPHRTSARNHLAGLIHEVQTHGPLLKVVVDVGFPIVALVTKNAAEELCIARGETISVAFKASAAHLIPRGSSDAIS